VHILSRHSYLLNMADYFFFYTVPSESFISEATKLILFFFFLGEGEVRVNMVSSLSPHNVSNLHDFQMEISYLFYYNVVLFNVAFTCSNYVAPNTDHK